MNESNKLDGELRRLTDLHEYQILDSSPEKEFDDIVNLASQICDTSISLITLLDFDRQWFKAKVGLEIEETKRNIAFCSHAIQQPEIMIVPDATQDERFVSNPLVTENPNIRFYAGVPLTTPQGNILGTLCVIDSEPKQLTEQQKFALETLAKQVVNQLELRKNAKKMERIMADLNDKNGKLEQLNQANNKLLSIIAHDLRTPFSNLSHLIEILETGSLSMDEIKYFSGKIKTSLNTSQNLLDNLLQWAFTQFEGEKISFTNFSIIEAIELVLKQNLEFALSKNNQMVSKVKQPVFIDADLNMVKFIIRNLVVNANKFTQSGTITIQANETVDSVEICVTDTGIGIPKQRLPHLFDWNKRRSTPGTSNEAGTGLGLQVCKELVELHHGKIRVESEINKGSAFYFTLPKKQPK